MKRLAFLLVLLAAPVAAQTTGERTYRLGQLAQNEDSVASLRSATLPELARLGFSEGRNLVVDARVVDASTMPGTVQEMLQGRPDAIIAVGPDAIRAVRDATRTVPIVAYGPDLVARGWAASLARPGGNITGVVILGAELLTFDAAGPGDYPAAFAAMRGAGAQGLVITSHPVFYRDAAALTALALEAGLPTICEFAEMARSGCLLAYGPSRPALRRRVADMVARVFRGAAPGDLPIEMPTHFDLAINLRLARALGVAISPALLVRADEVIE